MTTTIAQFSLPTESFALAETLPEYPSVSVEVDRIAAHIPDMTMPHFWATDGDEPGFREAMAADRTVREIQASADFDGERLYHVEWHDEIDEVVIEMVDHEGVILAASGRDDRWQFRVRFMTRDQFEAFRDYFADERPALRLDQLYTTEHPRQTRGDLTDDQRAALVTALELGYFEVPREASIREVADQLDVSHQAVSERLRRGTERLVREFSSVETIDDGG